jgi:soluble lytic murein transglycosylase-like protein
MVDYRELTRQAALQAHIDPDIFERQIKRESGFDPTAQNKISGASGIAQIIPKWHPGVDVWNPWESLLYAANLVKSYLNKYGNYDSALRAYNAGPNGNWDNPETNAYVSAILGNVSGETNLANDNGNTATNTDNSGCASIASTTALILLWLTLLLLDKIYPLHLSIFLLNR